jgi:hypothetical protein
MAYPQAPIEMDMYMELPDGFLLKEGNQKDHVLKLLANLYGQKQTGRVWKSKQAGRVWKSTNSSKST